MPAPRASAGGAEVAPDSPASPPARTRPLILREATDQMLVELRGATLQSCLSGLGSIWATSAGKESHYARTRRVHRLDYFVSHDWGTGRWVKLLALAVHFNGVPALCASFAVSLLVFVLQVAGVLAQRQPPQVRITAGVEYEEVFGVWCFPAGICTFFFVLIYWQVCSECVLSPTFVFVDKMCISQWNPEEKERGVCSIGGFLQRSDQMLMLCTPRYFSRMWCAFEVAAWLRLRNVDSIIFLPPSDAVFTGLWFSLVLCAHGCIYIGTQFPGVPLAPFALLVVFCAPLPLTHSARLVMRELLSLPELLRAHDVAETQCFCCTHQHVDPVTGSALMCDRDIVYEAIDCWYGSDTPCPSHEKATVVRQSSHEASAAERSAGTAHFNEVVQTKLSDALEIMVARPVSYVSCLIAASPAIWWYLDQITAMVLDGPHDPYLTFKRSLRMFITCFLLWPLICTSVQAEAKLEEDMTVSR
ncbi:unnamed protein product [Prorocentrum cordatum]|uniref:TIR domain-containing protein n=1 Tax=Prorocentrum cordatum TaxID=2364126 RepID=A0ABN9WR64_9DINO|nr:unnamed protein product [Polarella glacialis]